MNAKEHSPTSVEVHTDTRGDLADATGTFEGVNLTVGGKYELSMTIIVNERSVTCIPGTPLCSFQVIGPPVVKEKS